MSRYDHALDREPEDIQPENVRSFGFGDDIAKDLLKIRKNKRVPYFRLDENGKAHVGIVFTDPKKMFTGAYVHWYNKYFLCKTVSNRAICCERLNNRIFRVGCTIIKYFSDGEGYEIMPWCFGVSVYNKLKYLNETFPLEKYDIQVERTGNRFPIYDVLPLPAGSIWQERSDKNIILDKAEEYQKMKKDIIGQDLTVQQIQELIKEVK